MRLRSDERGFGLLELLMAMTMLSIGILAMLAAFNSGAVALQRASKLSTAAALADKQMELYRAVKYDEIALDATSLTTALTDTTYACDNAIKIDLAVACGTSNRKSQVTKTCTGSPLPDQCVPSRLVTGPDGKEYRVDTYVVEEPPTVSGSRPLRKVTVVVRDRYKLDGALVRAQSTFDQSTGS
jgi:prepilin-type N-terminal cleavage/methylation domain-containing protein